MNSDLHHAMHSINEIDGKREKAGLGTLSIGTYGVSGEIVSSTPIPGSRCGHEKTETADYGGYLLGEGMTHAAAVYLASLHNHYPRIAAALKKLPEMEGKIRAYELEREGWRREDERNFERMREAHAMCDRLKQEIVTLREKGAKQVQA